MRWVWHVESMGGKKDAYEVWWGNLRGRDYFGGLRSRHRLEDNIKIDFQEIGRGAAVDWIDLAQDRDRWQAVVNTVMNLWVHKLQGIF
jgi:hypothetical protein